MHSSLSTRDYENERTTSTETIVTKLITLTTLLNQSTLEDNTSTFSHSTTDIPRDDGNTVTENDYSSSIGM